VNISAKQQLVLNAIKNCPEAANNDALLLEQVWKNEGWSQDRSLYENLCSVTRPETISRRRRELHDMGLIEYSDKADTERFEAFKNEVEEHYAAVSWLED
jgi:hypothetical protein